MRLLGTIFLTAVEALLATAGVIAFVYGMDQRSPTPALVGASLMASVVLVFVVGRAKTPRERRPSLWLQGAVALLTVFVTAVLLVQLMLSSHRPMHMRNASSSLKTLASAEADFRANDRDNNGILDFWVGDVAGLYLLEPTGGGEPIKLIEISVAGADAAPTPESVRTRAFEPGPKAGYLFRALARDGNGVPYDEGSGRSSARFGFVAFPKTYRPESRKTFILNEDNTIWWKDTGGKPVADWPKDLKADGWSELD